jgi:hypothetical protein
MACQRLRPATPRDAGGASGFGFDAESITVNFGQGLLSPMFLPTYEIAGADRRGNFYRRNEIRFPLRPLLSAGSVELAMRLIDQAVGRARPKKIGGRGQPSITKTERLQSANLPQMPRGLVYKLRQPGRGYGGPDLAGSRGIDPSLQPSPCGGRYSVTGELAILANAVTLLPIRAQKKAIDVISGGLRPSLGLHTAQAHPGIWSETTTRPQARS